MTRYSKLLFFCRYCNLLDKFIRIPARFIRKAFFYKSGHVAHHSVGILPHALLGHSKISFR
jgi:hypothetical protein